MAFKSADCVRDLIVAGARYNKSVDFVQTCAEKEFVNKEDFVLAETRPNEALSVVEQAKKLDCKEGEQDEMKETLVSFKENTEVLNTISDQIAGFVCSRNYFLNQLDDPEEDHLDSKLTKIPEVKLWWIGSFGKETDIQWEEFFDAFSSYMDEVHQYSFNDVENKNDLERGLKTCLFKIKRALSGDSGAVWVDRQEVVVSMDDFKAFYQRFGPWKTLYLKSLTLCDYEGYPFPNFIPSTSRIEGMAFLKEMSRKKKLKYILRFSGQRGAFVYQSFDQNILIQNSTKGFSVDTRAGLKDGYTDIHRILTECWQAKEEQDGCVYWRRVVDVSMDKSVTAKAYDQLDPEKLEAQEIKEIRKVGSLVAGVSHQVDEVKIELDKMHRDVLKCILNVLTMQDSCMPKLFYILPDMSGGSKGFWEQFKERMQEKGGIVNCKLHILCEGARLVDIGGEKRYLCHDLEHEGFPIKFPTEKFLENVPHMRMGIGIVSLGLKATAAVVKSARSPVGVLVKELEKMDQNLAQMNDNLGDNELNMHDIAERHKEIHECFHVLRYLLRNQLEQDELRQGRCGELNLMWNVEEHRAAWVCPDHRVGLEPLDEDQISKFMFTDDQKDQDDDADDLKVQTIPEYKLKVTCLKAKHLKNVEIFKAVDLSDPYVEITPFDASGNPLELCFTEHITNNLNPEWDATFEWTTTSSEIEKIAFQVWDHNRVREDVEIGTCEVKLHYRDGKFILPPEPARNLLTKKNKHGGELFVDIECTVTDIPLV